MSTPAVTLAWPIDMQRPRANGRKPTITGTYTGHLFLRNPPSTAPGLDIAVDEHTEVYAAAGGRAKLGHNDTAGNHVLIQHDRHTATLYCHLSAVWLVQNQHILPGEIIGLAGATGHTIGGPHLHFSVIHRPGSGTPQDGDYIDPLPLLPTVQEASELPGR